MQLRLPACCLRGRIQLNTVLITGATGFVGRALSAKMMEGPWQIRGAVRTSEQARVLPPGMEAISVGSIGPATDWSAALKGVDTVIHLAAAVSKTGSEAGEGDAFHNVNVLGTQRLAEAAVESGVRRLVFLSSIEVNGSVNNGKPFTEEDKPNPQTYYGSSKLKAESELLRIADATDLEVVIIRPPLVYGPGKMGNLMSFIMSLVNRGVPLPLASIANQRSFIYIENLLDAIVSCCNNASAVGNIFLVSDGSTISTPELIRLIAQEMEKKPRLISFPVTWLKLAGKNIGKSSALKLLTDSYHVDSSKIQKVVGWKTPFSIEEGIGVSVNASMRND